MAAKKIGALHLRTKHLVNGHQIMLFTDLNKFTLKQLEDSVLKNELEMVEPDVILNGKVLISGVEEGILDGTKTLSETKVRDGSIISVGGIGLNSRIKIVLHHREKREDNYPEFVIFKNIDYINDEDSE